MVAFSQVDPTPVKIVECPRDAWQGMPRLIPAERKAEYLRALVRAGFRHIDAVSFVSPAAVPQMADSARVLALLGPVTDVEIIGIVVNQLGAERALATGAVHTLGFPYSISPTFLERNQRQDAGQARHILEAITRLAFPAGVGVTAYVSMAFGNPYGERWDPDDVIAACRSLMEIGVADISLADTVGAAGPEQIFSVLSAVAAEVPGIALGAHLHSRPDQASARLSAAYRAGCRRLDMAIGGQGGCPFAQDALVGNIDTQAALADLASWGAPLPELASLDALLTMSSDIADKFGTAV